MKCSLAIMAFALIATGLTAAASDLKIVEEGKSHAIIVIDKAAKPCVRKAAEELRFYIRSISGAELQVVAIDPAKQNAMEALRGKTIISLGENPLSRQAGLKSDAIRDDGFIIRCDGQRIFIAGKDGQRYGDNYNEHTDSAGTLYGVYSILESLGVRWFYPNELGTIIPNASTITIKEQDREEYPFFNYRNTGFNDYEWRRRTSAGGTCNVWSTKHEVSLELKDKLYTSNPEWFLIRPDGTRSAQANLLLPQIQDEMAKMAEMRFSSKIDEGCKYFNILPLDGDACNNINSDWILACVEKLAWRMLKSYSRYKIVHSPYCGSLTPPARVRELPPNMVLLICMNRADLLNDQKRDDAYDLIARWQEFRPAAIYFCRYNGILLRGNPALFPHLISSDIKHLSKISGEGKAIIDGEMNFSGGIRPDSESAWWEYINEYVAAKMLWNPNTDVDALMQDFCDKMFGSASSDMAVFFRTCENAYSDPGQRDIFSVSTVEKLDEALTAARKKVKDDVIVKRIDFFSAGIAPLRAVKDKMLSDKNDSSLPIERGMIAYFPLDEGAGNMVKDAMSSLTCLAQNIDWGDGMKGNAIVFTGKDSYAKMFCPISLKNTDYSLEAWIKPEGMAGLQYILGPDNYQRQMLAVNYSYPTPGKGVSGRLVIKHRTWAESYDASNVELQSAIIEFKEGKWYHVVGTFSAKSGMTLYLNGKIVGINTNLKTQSGMGLYYIGASGSNKSKPATGCFQGSIDEVKIYNRELSYGEVKKEYIQGLDERK